MAGPDAMANSSQQRTRAASSGINDQTIKSTTDSSMCSLLKSSDEFTSNTSDEGGSPKESPCPIGPTLSDPFWLTNVDLTPQLMLNYTMKLNHKADVLKKDMAFLRRRNQPDQVSEQLAQLYTELEDTGDVIKPLLEAEASTSCGTTTSGSSAGEECEEIMNKANNQKQVQIILFPT
jgi:hypothetical protein